MLTTTFGGITGLLVAGGLLLRRRISKNWISRSAICAQRFTKQQTVIITGGNTGIGFEVAKELANWGCKVIVACRDINAGNLAASNIRQMSGNKDVVCMTCDLSSLDSVRKFAADLDRNDNIYALICNAGVWMPQKGAKTEDGFEIHFGVNHLGHFALVQLLLPQMEKSGMDSRIIIVGSTLCKSGKIDVQNVSEFVYDGRIPEAGEKSSFAPAGYCDSKLMNMLMCRELAARLQRANSNVTTYAASPGFCQSRLGRNANKQMAAYKRMMFVPLMRFFQRSPAQGAYNILFTMGDREKLESGSMYQDGVVWEDGLSLVEKLGDDLQTKLWDLSEELIKEKTKA